MCNSKRISKADNAAPRTICTVAYSRGPVTDRSCWNTEITKVRERIDPGAFSADAGIAQNHRPYTGLSGKISGKQATMRCCNSHTTARARVQGRHAVKNEMGAYQSHWLYVLISALI